MLRAIIFSAVQFLITKPITTYIPGNINSRNMPAGLKQKTAKIILKKWTAGSTVLAVNLLRGTLSVHKLEDIEWKFGVTAANSELEHVRTHSKC